jgi:hypothetical protein
MLLLNLKHRRKKSKKRLRNNLLRNLKNLKSQLLRKRRKNQL